MAVKFTIDADGSKAQEEIRGTGKAFRDLDKDVGVARKGLNLAKKGWDLYAGSQKGMAAGVIELSRGFGKLSPTAKSFVSTTDRLEERFGPLEGDIKGVNEELKETSQILPVVNKEMGTTDEKASNSAVSFIAFANAVQLGETALRAASGLYGVVAGQFGKIQERADMADDVAKTSKAFGVNAQALQAWRSAGMLAGTDAGVVDRAFLNIQKSAFDASLGLSTAIDLFDEAGVSATNLDGSMRPAEDILREVSQRMADGLIPTTKQAAISSNLLRDRTGRMLNTLREGPAVIDANQARLASYGALMGDKLLTASEEWNDSTQRANELQTGFGNTLALGVLPALAAAQNAFVSTAAEGGGLRDRIGEILGEGELLAKGILTLAEGMATIPASVAAAIGDATIKIFGFFDGLTDRSREMVSVARGVADALHMDGASQRLLAVDKRILGVKASLAGAKQEAAGFLGTIGDGATAANEKVTTFATSFVDEYGRIRTAMNEDLIEPLDDAKNAMKALGDEAEETEKKLMWWETKRYMSTSDLLKKQRREAAKKDSEADKAAKKADKAYQQQINGSKQLGANIGTIASNMATAESAGDAFKSGLKGSFTLALQKIGEIVAAQIAGNAATAASSVAGSQAQTAAAIPAATAVSIAGAGLNVPIAIGALTAGIGLITGLFSAIGDRGIEGMPGAGRMTVSKLGSETLLDPVGTTKYHKQMDMVTDIIRSSGLGVMGRGGSGGGGGVSETHITLEIGGRPLLTYIDRKIADMMRTGSSDIGRMVRA